MHIRSVRARGGKEIKADLDGKLIGKDEGRVEGKKVGLLF